VIEDVEIRCADRVTLRASVREPVGESFGTAILAHAMFARRGEFERAGFAEHFARRGWRTIAFDFRGHGDSDGKGTEYRYDDFVMHDLPAVTEAARARSDGRPVVVIGHSLGGHVALAAQGIGTMRADAIVGIASNVWMRRTERSSRVRLVQHAVLRAVMAIVARRGYFPARALRQGSDDESASYMRDLARFVFDDKWGSADGAHDYTAALSAIDVPVYSLATAGDRLAARPDAVCELHRMARAELDVVTASDAGGRAPSHIGIVTTRSAVSAWSRVEAFLRERLA